MEEISKSRKEKIEKEIERLINHRNILEEFSKTENQELKGLLKEILLKEEIGYINDWIEFYIEEKKKLIEREIKPVETVTKQIEPITKSKISFNFNKLVIPAIILILIIAGIFFIKPTITGYVTVTRETDYNQTIDKAFTAYTEYPWFLEKSGNLRSIRLSGIISKDGYAQVYLMHNNNRYIILDSNRLAEEGIIEITGMAVSDDIITNITETNITESLENESIINESLENKSINKIIKIALGYNTGTAYDTDDNGIETTEGIIDFTIENTEFSWNVDYSRLCTKWETYSLDNDEITTICYGSDICCNFINIIPTSLIWNESFLTAYGQYGATYNNVISAQILYVDYNTSLEKPYTDIHNSEWQSLNAAFYEDKLSFSNVCIDTCLLDGFNETFYTLIVNVSNATITIDTISYSILEEIQKLQLQLNVEDNIKQIEANFLLYKNKTLTNETTIEPGLYDIEIIPEEKVIEKIKFEEVNITEPVIEIGIDNVTKDISIENIEVKKKFAIDVSQIEFNNATFTSTATASSLYKCKEWDFKTETCYGVWVKIKELVIGEEYNLTLTQDDPGFVEGDLILPAEAKLNITPKLKPDKKDFKLDENASFEFEFVTEKELIRHNKPLEKSIKPKQTKKWVTATETIETFVYDSLGKSAAVEPEIEELREGKFKVNLPKQRQFKAGKYVLKVELIKDGVSYTQEQNFTWGVLAINTHKSIYLPNENAFIGIGVLNDEGKMVCNASVALEITDPLNQKTTLTTADGGIKVSPECEVYGVTNLPDFYTNYTIAGTGTYIMNLTAETYNGVRTVSDGFAVQSSVDFDVARQGPTRIYPIVPYTMNFTIKANQNYNGVINEYVPASFIITNQSGLTITETGDTKILIWNVNLKRGDIINLHYEFDAPDISPEFYILGPLEIGSFAEIRQWQIANDAPAKMVWTVTKPGTNPTAGSSFQITISGTSTNNPNAGTMDLRHDAAAGGCSPVTAMLATCGATIRQGTSDGWSGASGTCGTCAQSDYNTLSYNCASAGLTCTIYADVYACDNSQGTYEIATLTTPTIGGATENCINNLVIDAAPPPNVPPQVSAIINSTPENKNQTSDTLWCFNTSQSDAEGNNIVVTWNWYNSSDDLTYYIMPFTDQNLSSGNTTKDQYFKCQVNANDGTDTNSTNSTFLKILNTAPTTGIPVIINSTPANLNITTSTLWLFNNTGQYDDDGDSLTISYRWFNSSDNVNWELMPFTDQNLSSGNTTKGQYFIGEITLNDGTATNSTNSTSLLIRNAIPEIFYVNFTQLADLIDGGISYVNFTFNVSDADNFNDINHSLTKINITLGKDPGQQAYNNSNCTVVSEYNINYIQYLCKVMFYYYYNASSSWIVNASVADGTGASTFNDTMRFTVNSLTAMRLVSTAVNFSSNAYAGVNDVAAATNPFVINNTGNFDFSKINITAQNLTGVTNPAQVITPGNITVNTTDYSGIPMLQGQSVTIPSANLTHGAPGVGNLSLYFYIDVPAGMQAQVYNVTYPWEITLE